MIMKNLLHVKNKKNKTLFKRVFYLCRKISCKEKDNF